MKKADLSNRFITILATLSCFANTIFADIPTPSSKRMPDEPTGHDWGLIIGGSLFAFAGALIVIWTARKLSKRSLK